MERSIRVCLWEVKGDAFADQQIALARCLYELGAIEYRDLPVAALYRTWVSERPASRREGLCVTASEAPAHLGRKHHPDLGIEQIFLV
jgi:hypothetical protein